MKVSPSCIRIDDDIAEYEISIRNHDPSDICLFRIRRSEEKVLSFRPKKGFILPGENKIITLNILRHDFARSKLLFKLVKVPFSHPTEVTNLVEELSKDYDSVWAKGATGMEGERKKIVDILGTLYESSSQRMNVPNSLQHQTLAKSASFTIDSPLRRNNLNLPNLEDSRDFSASYFHAGEDDIDDQVSSFSDMSSIHQIQPSVKLSNILKSSANSNNNVTNNAFQKSVISPLKHMMMYDNAQQVSVSNNSNIVEEVYTGHSSEKNQLNSPKKNRSNNVSRDVSPSNVCRVSQSHTNAFSMDENKANMNQFDLSLPLPAGTLPPVNYNTNSNNGKVSNVTVQSLNLDTLQTALVLADALSRFNNTNGNNNSATVESSKNVSESLSLIIPALNNSNSTVNNKMNSKATDSNINVNHFSADDLYDGFDESHNSNTNNRSLNLPNDNDDRKTNTKNVGNDSEDKRYNVTEEDHLTMISYLQPQEKQNICDSDNLEKLLNRFSTVVTIPNSTSTGFCKYAVEISGNPELSNGKLPSQKENDDESFNERKIHETFIANESLLDDNLNADNALNKTQLTDEIVTLLCEMQLKRLFLQERSDSCNAQDKVGDFDNLDDTQAKVVSLDIQHACVNSLYSSVGSIFNNQNNKNESSSSEIEKRYLKSWFSQHLKSLTVKHSGLESLTQTKSHQMWHSRFISLTHLDLSHNNLSSDFVDFPLSFPQLRVLNLSHNRFTSLDGLQSIRSPHFTSLNMSFNLIPANLTVFLKNMAIVSGSKFSRTLKHWNLTGNPISTHRDTLSSYVDTVLLALPRLTQMDGLDLSYLSQNVFQSGKSGNLRMNNSVDISYGDDTLRHSKAMSSHSQTMLSQLLHQNKHNVRRNSRRHSRDTTGAPPPLPCQLQNSKNSGNNSVQNRTNSHKKNETEDFYRDFVQKVKRTLQSRAFQLAKQRVLKENDAQSKDNDINHVKKSPKIKSIKDKSRHANLNHRYDNNSDVVDEDDVGSNLLDAENDESNNDDNDVNSDILMNISESDNDSERSETSFGYLKAFQGNIHHTSDDGDNTSNMKISQREHDLMLQEQLLMKELELLKLKRLQLSQNIHDGNNANNSGGIDNKKTQVNYVDGSNTVYTHTVTSNKAVPLPPQNFSPPRYNDNSSHVNLNNAANRNNNSSNNYLSNNSIFQSNNNTNNNVNGNNGVTHSLMGVFPTEYPSNTSNNNSPSRRQQSSHNKNTFEDNSSPKVAVRTPNKTLSATFPANPANANSGSSFTPNKSAPKSNFVTPPATQRRHSSGNSNTHNSSSATFNRLHSTPTTASIQRRKSHFNCLVSHWADHQQDETQGDTPLYQNNETDDVTSTYTSSKHSLKSTMKQLKHRMVAKRDTETQFMATWLKKVVPNPSDTQKLSNSGFFEESGEGGHSVTQTQSNPLYDTLVDIAQENVKDGYGLFAPGYSTKFTPKTLNKITQKDQILGEYAQAAVVRGSIPRYRGTMLLDEKTFEEMQQDEKYSIWHPRYRVPKPHFGFSKPFKDRPENGGKSKSAPSSPQRLPRTPASDNSGLRRSRSASQIFLDDADHSKSFLPKKPPLYDQTVQRMRDGFEKLPIRGTFSRASKGLPSTWYPMDVEDVDAIKRQGYFHETIGDTVRHSARDPYHIDNNDATNDNNSSNWDAVSQVSQATGVSQASKKPLIITKQGSTVILPDTPRSSVSRAGSSSVSPVSRRVSLGQHVSRRNSLFTVDVSQDTSMMPVSGVSPNRGDTDTVVTGVSQVSQTLSSVSPGKRRLSYIHPSVIATVSAQAVSSFASVASITPTNDNGHSGTFPASPFNRGNASPGANNVHSQLFFRNNNNVSNNNSSTTSNNNSGSSTPQRRQSLDSGVSQLTFSSSVSQSNANNGDSSANPLNNSRRLSVQERKNAVRRSFLSSVSAQDLIQLSHDANHNRNNAETMDNNATNNNNNFRANDSQTGTYSSEYNNNNNNNNNNNVVSSYNNSNNYNEQTNNNNNNNNNNKSNLYINTDLYSSETAAASSNPSNLNDKNHNEYTTMLNTTLNSTSSPRLSPRSAQNTYNGSANSGGNANAAVNAIHPRKSALSSLFSDSDNNSETLLSKPETSTSPVYSNSETAASAPNNNINNNNNNEEDQLTSYLSWLQSQSQPSLFNDESQINENNHNSSLNNTISGISLEAIAALSYDD